MKFVTSAKNLILATAALLVLALPAAAQIRFAVTGTALTTTHGYIQGQSYTFLFTTPSSYPVAPLNTTFSGTENTWDEEWVVDRQLWTSVSGTGVQGSFVRPVLSDNDPYSLITTNTTDSYLKLYAGGDLSDSIGLSTLGNPGTGDIKSVEAILGGVTPFVPANTFIDPVTYFEAYTGNYDSLSGYIIRVYSTNLGEVIEFTPTSVAITAVPEPSTYAAFAGLAALGLVLVRKRR